MLHIMIQAVSQYDKRRIADFRSYHSHTMYTEEYCVDIDLKLRDLLTYYAITVFDDFFFI